MSVRCASDWQGPRTKNVGEVPNSANVPMGQSVDVNVVHAKDARAKVVRVKVVPAKVVRGKVVPGKVVRVKVVRVKVDSIRRILC